MAAVRSAAGQAESPPRVVVVGGGISGLAAAHRLARLGIAVTLLEASPRLGGKLGSAELAGVLVDTGAESLLNRRPEAVDLVDQVGLGGDLCHPATASAAVWTRGAVRPLPPTVLGVPSDLAALARSGVVSRSGVVRAGLDRLAAVRGRVGEPVEDVAVGTFAARRLGGEVRDRLVEPLLGGVYAGHADELSLLAAAPQIAALARAGGSLLGAAERARLDSTQPNTPLFAGVVGGVGRLPAAVAAAATANGATIRTRATVRALVGGDAGGAGRCWQLVVGSAESPALVEADAVVLATPAAATAKLLEPVVPLAAIELRRIDAASVAIVSLALPGTCLPAPPGGSGFLVPPIDGRAAKAVTWSTTKWAWLHQRTGRDVAAGTVVVRVSFGRHRDAAVLQRDDTELVDLAAGELADAVGLSGPLLDARVDRWGGALPQYAVGHLSRVERIRTAVEAVAGLDVCGAAYDGVGVAACVADGWRAAEATVERMGTMRT